MHANIVPDERALGNADDCINKLFIAIGYRFLHGEYINSSNKSQRAGTNTRVLFIYFFFKEETDLETKGTRRDTVSKNM